MWRKINFEFLTLGFIVLLANAPYLPSTFIPSHDTLYVFTFFYPFYNEWFFHHQIVQWFPYNTYGLPANFYQVWALTPVYYLLVVLGSLFRIEDVLWIFKIGVLSEFCVFLLGFYWLSNLLYKDRRTVFLICLTAVMSVAWYGNINVGFRFYYLFPMVASFLVLCYQQRRAEFLWLAGIVGLMWWLQGSVTYHVVAGAFACFIFLCCLLISSQGLWRMFFSPTRANRVCLLLFIALFVFFAFYYKQALEGVSFYAPGRDATTGTTTLENFLVRGGVMGWEKLLRGFLFASPPFLWVGSLIDTSIYVGIIPFLLFIWSVMKVRNKIFLVFLTTMILLLLFSFGGYFTRLSYYFPGMAYYRHISFMIGIVKVLILICAGFGLDEFWGLARRKKLVLSFSIWAILFFICEGSSELRQDFLKHWGWGYEKLKTGITLTQINSFPFLFSVTFWAFLIFLITVTLLYVLRGTYPVKKERVLFYGLVLFLMGDLFVFQGRVYDTAFQLPSSSLSAIESLKVNKLEYQPIRTLEAFNVRQQQAWELVRLSPPTAKYATSFNFIQLDYCDHLYRADLVVSGVLQLVSIPNIKRFLVGCFYPKLRLVHDSVDYNDLTRASIAISKIKKTNEPVVLYKLKGDYNQVPENEPTYSGEDTIEVKSYKANALLAQVNIGQRQDAWLVYADSFHPNWRAQVNGKEVLIQQAYLAFKAVYLKKGKNTVRFFYAPAKATMSVLLSLINIFFGIMFCILFIGQLFYPISQKRKGLFY